ncbi:MAG TPA: hypothetical protein VFI00_04450, partial [Kribbella sp.]|nr:hypothetical protein [Kribbella sp.]
SSIYTDRLWYRSEGYGNVFSKLFWTRTGLFVVFGLLMAGAVVVVLPVLVMFLLFQRHVTKGIAITGLK